MLALVVWREARGETPEAQFAVACSILNRVKRPSWWGHDLLGVLGKKWQYSSMAAPNDPQLILWPQIDGSWCEALSIARAALNESEPNPVPGADSYYDDSISAPAWTKAARFVQKIGRLNFYDTDHDFEADVIKQQA